LGAKLKLKTFESALGVIEEESLLVSGKERS
jgi:hypothetical protein